MKALSLLIGLTLSAASADAATFTFRINAEPETLDWNRAHTVVENYLLINLMEGLLTLDADLKVQNALAESWKKSADGKIYTFKIRKNAKWSDGVALKAQDFVYSWKRLITASTAASYAYLLFDVVGAEAYFKGEEKDFNKVGIRAVDDATFEVKLTKPVAHWVYIPSFWVTFPLRQDLVEKYGPQWPRPGKMVTVGPYVLSRHEPESQLVFAANPHYYGKRGNVSEVIAQIVKDDSTALTLYESGKIDYMTDLPSLDLPRLKTSPDLKSFPYLKTAYLGFSVNVPGVQSDVVRRAIAMAIDKSKFADILHGSQKGATSFIPPGMMGHSPSIGLQFDPVKARAELKKAGPVPALTILTGSGERPSTVAQYLQSELKKNLGLEVNVQAYDHKTFRATLPLHKNALFLLTWSADYPDPDNFMSIFTSESGINQTGWKDGKYDEFVMAGRFGLKPPDRDRLYAKAQKVLLEDGVAIAPLYYESNLALVKPRVMNFKLSPINYFYIKDLNVGS